MQSGWIRFVARLLIVSFCALPYSSQAALVGTDQLLGAAQQQGDRAKVNDFLGRSAVQQQLQLFGLTDANAKQRVAAMTDEEVRTLAGKIDSLPAGASSNGTTLAVVIIIAVIIWYVWK